MEAIVRQRRLERFAAECGCNVAQAKLVCRHAHAVFAAEERAASCGREEYAQAERAVDLARTLLGDLAAHFGCTLVFAGMWPSLRKADRTVVEIPDLTEGN